MIRKCHGVKSQCRDLDCWILIGCRHGRITIAAATFSFGLAFLSLGLLGSTTVLDGDVR
jgi:hypothetical protein